MSEEKIWPLPAHLYGLSRAEAVAETVNPSTPLANATPAQTSPAFEEPTLPPCAPLISELAEQALKQKIKNGAWDKGRDREISGAVRLFIATNGDIPVNAIKQSHLIAMKDLFLLLPIVYDRLRHDHHGKEALETGEEALDRVDELRKR